MMRREDGRVVIDLSVDEFMALANAVNEGNPNWTPYAVPKDGARS